MLKANSNDSIEDLVSVFSNESRLLILFKLNEKKEKISKLSKSLDLNIQDTHRNVNKMINAVVIHKDSEGFLELTPIGKIAVLLFPSMNFIFKNKIYFKTHFFDGLPKKYAERIGVMNSCELVSGVAKVFEKWVEMIDDADEYHKVIAAQAPLEPVEKALIKASKGLKLRILLGKNTVFPEKYPILLKKYNASKLELNGFFDTKMIDKVDYCLVMSEKEASISFTNKNGVIDIDQTFFGKNPEFLEWCNDLFEETWKNEHAIEAFMSKRFEK